MNSKKTQPDVELSLVLPVYNQASYIAGVVREIEETLRRARLNYELILAENRSPDNTLEVLQKIARNNPRIRVVESPIKGYGGAIIEGYKVARGRWVAHMGSTGMIEPELVVRCLKVVRNGDADIAKPYRAVRENIVRRLNSFAYNLLANIMFGVKTHDTNSCPKVFSRRWVPVFDLQYRDSFLDLELLAKARLMGLKVVEIPTRHRPRESGKSNTSFRTVLEFVGNMLRFRRERRLQKWWNALPNSVRNELAKK